MRVLTGLSCAEVEVVRRLRAAGIADAGRLATCGSASWSPYQRPRSSIRHDLEALIQRPLPDLPASGSGAPDVVGLLGPHPVFVECKGREPLQANGSRRYAARPVSESPASPELQDLLQASDAATGFDRIGYRDPIAAHGLTAINPLLDRIDRGVHPAFAVTVLEAIGRSQRAEAMAALSAAARRIDVRELARASLDRLGRAASPWGSQGRSPGVLEDVPAMGKPPPRQGPRQFLTRAGKPCQNPGRYWRDGRWSCSRNRALQASRPGRHLPGQVVPTPSGSRP